ncbi:hypothetical protein JW935_06705 [candidate division KSB1 bacterium]|nr:hypothetical protein [candidate division KSB1 bacterium]
MIRSIGELLKKLLEHEVKLLEDQNIRHPPAIGLMYEGLTQRITARAIPECLKLNVRSGFIYNDDNILSRQIDCMIVIGRGKKIPYTDDYKYHFKNVVAVIEVKKNLLKMN